jgi:hypothetical protein
MELYVGWEFKQATTAALPWIWREIEEETGSVLKQSRGSFATLYACIEDARVHGYAGGRLQKQSSEPQ